MLKVESGILKSFLKKIIDKVVTDTAGRETPTEEDDHDHDPMRDTTGMIDTRRNLKVLSLLSLTLGHRRRSSSSESSKHRHRQKPLKSPSGSEHLSNS